MNTNTPEKEKIIREPSFLDALIPLLFMIALLVASSENIRSAAINLAEMIILIVAISLGVLMGTLLVAPNKFVLMTSLNEHSTYQKG